MPMKPAVGVLAALILSASADCARRDVASLGAGSSAHGETDTATSHLGQLASINAQLPPAAARLLIGGVRGNVISESIYDRALLALALSQPALRLNASGTIDSVAFAYNAARQALDITPGVARIANLAPELR